MHIAYCIQNVIQIYENMIPWKCNEDWKWTKHKGEESLDLENRPKVKTKILQNLEKSSKTFEDRNFFEDTSRLLEIGRRRRWTGIFWQKSSKNEDLRRFIAILKWTAFHVRSRGSTIWRGQQQFSIM